MYIFPHPKYDLNLERLFFNMRYKEGTTVRDKLVKSIERNQNLDMMYIDKTGNISRRRITVLQVGDCSFRAYCYLRNRKRTFMIDNVLALMTVLEKERVCI